MRYKILVAHGYEKLMILTICQAYRKVRKLSEKNKSLFYHFYLSLHSMLALDEL